MKFKDESFPIDIKELNYYELYSSIHNSLINKGYRINNGLVDLLDSLHEWMEKNTQQINIRHTIPLFNKIENEHVIEMAKSHCIMAIAEELQKRDHFTVIKTNNEIEITFRALVCNVLGRVIRVPMHDEAPYFIRKD